ncbi:MAG: hypothetical protein COU11_00600 [Candidatus Harrisonbacteria bacterium CG10_big_fil_rev_8_21_14_0_10_49_15]|uniref:SsuA/THI5-like domain-containing protein n=1 Tax=Candidatus Harrisonbacteria bacterium CG10_big_fil_rev_8_21_14_0_10_49_15 TaxID=1974587 RepID=A0A2H0ULZ4_9BACT|nr:MAG: hypothetical protein COU11_00600 [Candidatus Harrisonbacteria bacterium CG10_big_fil_rev_8_21_14_0_10_49_15]
MSTKIKIGYLPILDHVTLGVAAHNDRELFERLNIEPQRYENSDALGSAFASGEVAGIFSLFPFALKLFREGVDSRVLLLGHREGQSLVVREEIKTAADLKGKTIFIPHKYSTHYILLEKILQQAGLRMTDIQLDIGYEKITDVPKKFASGEVDGVIIAEPMATEIIRNGGGHTLTLSRDMQKHHVDCIFVARQDFLEQSGEVAAALVDSLVRAGGFINSYPRQASEIAEEFLGWPKDLLLESLAHDKGHILFWDLLPRLEDFEELQRIAVEELGLWKEEIDLSRWIAPELAQAAYRDWVIDLRKNTKDRGRSRTVPGSFSDAVVLFHDALGANVRITGLKLILPGSAYPPGVLRNPYEEGALGDFKTGGAVFELAGEEAKAVQVFSDTATSEPEFVLLRLNQEQLGRCLTALGFGQLGTATSVQTELALVLAKETIVTWVEGESVWLRLSLRTFRFLGLLLGSS